MKSKERILITERECKICGEVKDLNEYYYQNKKYADGTPYIYYNPECKQCTSKRSSKWAKDNWEYFQYTLKKKYYKTEKGKQQRKRNRERMKDKHERWRKENKHKLLEYSQKHRKHDIDDNEWESCKKYFNHSCAYCGMKEEESLNYYGQRLHKEHVDHEGENNLSNCIPACKGCNTYKTYKKKWKNGTVVQTFFYKS